MSLRRQALEAASSYLRQNPTELSRAVFNLIGLRVGVPLDALRWMLERVARSGSVKDPVLHEVPPGMRITATFDLMKTPVRGSAVVYIDRMAFSPSQLRIETRLEEIWLEVQGDVQSPIAALLRSGALDLSKPGNLAKFMPKRPPVLVESHDDIIVLDLMQNPKFASNDRVRGILGTLTPVVNVSGLSTEGDFLILQLRASPFGIPRALNAARALASG